MNSKVIVSYILIHLEVKDFHINSHKCVNVLKIRVNVMCKRIRQIGLTKAEYYAVSNEHHFTKFNRALSPTYCSSLSK